MAGRRIVSWGIVPAGEELLIGGGENGSQGVLLAGIHHHHGIDEIG